MLSLIRMADGMLKEADPKEPVDTTLPKKMQLMLDVGSVKIKEQNFLSMVRTEKFNNVIVMEMIPIRRKDNSYTIF